jgi:hypothetical protein
MLPLLNPIPVECHCVGDGLSLTYLIVQVGDCYSDVHESVVPDTRSQRVMPHR